eukprot:10800540-Heterocapsa_arctica.AAC.1
MVGLSIDVLNVLADLGTGQFKIIIILVCLNVFPPFIVTYFSLFLLCPRPSLLVDQIAYV